MPVEGALATPAARGAAVVLGARRTDRLDETVANIRAEGGRADPEQGAQAQQAMARLGVSPDAVARAIAFAIGQPDDVEIGDITIRPTRQG